ncbi:hypothetical protein L3Y34_019377 [Caenorhabditis briggsae]|uniref:Uncharacterized protein n=1 Tax=Caenorhabditis briggsae TaxID=6238 RepID=A0AAE9IW12_CAEBR|nr:hypothetical protein L3Y34_019377 [Caenorhabditis briggsae]
MKLHIQQPQPPVVRYRLIFVAADKDCSCWCCYFPDCRRPIASSHFEVRRISAISSSRANHASSSMMGRERLQTLKS